MSAGGLKLDIDRGGGGRRSTLRAELDPDSDQLAALTDSVREFVAPVDETQAYRVELSIDELLSNVIRYGLIEGRPSTIRVEVSLLADRIHIVIDHEGISFDPFVEAPTPDISLPLEEREIGGLGVFLVKSLMTSAEYERIGECNRITLTRLLDAARTARYRASSPRRESP